MIIKEEWLLAILMMIMWIFIWIRKPSLAILLIRFRASKKTERLL